MTRDGLTRRDIMRYGGATVVGTAGLTLAGIGGYAWPHSASADRAGEHADRPGYAGQ